MTSKNSSNKHFSLHAAISAFSETHLWAPRGPLLGWREHSCTSPHSSLCSGPAAPPRRASPRRGPALTTCSAGDVGQIWAQAPEVSQLPEALLTSPGHRMDSQDHKLDTWQVASHDNCHTVLGEKTLAQSEPALRERCLHVEARAPAMGIWVSQPPGAWPGQALWQVKSHK